MKIEKIKKIPFTYFEIRNQSRAIMHAAMDNHNPRLKQFTNSKTFPKSTIAIESKHVMIRDGIGVCFFTWKSAKNDGK